MTVHELLTQLENFVRANYVDDTTPLDVSIHVVERDGTGTRKVRKIEKVRRSTEGRRPTIQLVTD